MEEPSLATLPSHLDRGDLVRNRELSCGATHDFEEKLDAIGRAASFSLAAMLYAAVLTAFLGLEARTYKLVNFAAILIVLPVGSAAAMKAVRRLPLDYRRLIDLTSYALVMVSGISLAGISVVVWVLGTSVPTSNLIMRVGLTALVLSHFIGLLTASILLNRDGRARLVVRDEWLVTLGGKFTAPVAFLLVLSGSMLLTFHIGAGNPLLNASIALVRGLAPAPGWIVVVPSLAFAAFVLLICFRLLKRGRMPDAGALPLNPMKSSQAALTAAMLAVAYFYFDYKLDADPLHFLTNAGPASQIMFAHSVPMVTAFSQYGPGPMLLTWLAFLVSSPSLGAANVMAQVLSILFYLIMLVCLFRMTPYRGAAMWLGFFAVGVLLVGWWSGNGNLNSVPSSMGSRYLPNGILVLALSFLQKGRQVSSFVFVGMVISALWSFETFSGSVAIFGLFALIGSVRERSFRRLIRALLSGVVAPVATSVILLSCLTLVWGRMLPNYLAYLQFARVYNMVSEFWSIEASGAFFGWIPVAATIMVVLTTAWFSALDEDKPGALFDWDTLLNRFVPMAALCGFMSSYFAGRSVDFTLIIAFLPLSALLIPGSLVVFDRAMSGNKQAIRIVVVPLLAIFVAISFSFMALYRKDGPYSIAVAECLYHKNCSPVALGAALMKRLQTFDLVRNASPLDGLTKDAITLIERYSADRSEIPLFLGMRPAGDWSVHTNAVLLLEHKGHRWPISYVLSDEINSSLSRSILGADVRLEEGEPVFIRTDESRLGPLEAAIVTKIRSEVRLCPLPPSSLTVTAYRATYLPQCYSGT